MSLQEKIAGNAVYYIFGLSILLVFFMLAGQYESWITPLAVILAVPMALLGTVAALIGLGVPNNMYVQIGLVLLIALSAKNAILVVEMARENRAAGKSIVDSAVEAAALRFRPIMMTSLTSLSLASSPLFSPPAPVPMPPMPRNHRSHRNDRVHLPASSSSRRSTSSCRAGRNGSAKAKSA